MGGIAADAGTNWRIGGKIDFTSADHSKRKDLRHINHRLDLKVAPGIMHHSNHYAIGFSYIFSKNSESVSAEEIGTAAIPYCTFLDKGLMYGVYEAWSGSGVHLSESGISGFPIKELFHGVAVQAQWGSLHGDVEYLHFSGIAGEKEVIQFEFPAHWIIPYLRYRFAKGSTEHFLRINLSWPRQINDEDVLRQEMSNGITTTHVYGFNRIFERKTLSVQPEYELIALKEELRAGVEISSFKSITTQMYPYVASQAMTCGRAYVSGVLHAGRLDVKTAASLSVGDFTERSRTTETTVGPGDSPYRLTNYYHLQSEYTAAPRAATNVGLRYHSHWGVYAEIQGGYTYGFDLEYIAGSGRWNETIKLGYIF